jgi:hypothetical protein
MGDVYKWILGKWFLRKGAELNWLKVHPNAIIGVEKLGSPSKKVGSLLLVPLDSS